MLVKLYNRNRLRILSSGFLTLLFLLHHGGFPSIYCPFNLLFNTPCPACGLSRSAACVINGDFSQSITYHPLGFILVAFLIFSILTNRGLDTDRLTGKLICVMIITLFLVAWVFRVFI